MLFPLKKTYSILHLFITNLLFLGSKFVYNYDSHVQSTVNSLVKTSRHLSFKLQSKLEVTKIWQNPSNNETIFSIQVLLFTFRWGKSFT